MENNDMVVQPKKKSKAPLIIILLLIIFALGVCAGIYIPKLLDKNSKDNTSENGNKDTGTEKEESKKEDEVEEEKDTYVKPEANSKYKLLKEVNETVTLNKKEYHLDMFYYDHNEYKQGILKEVYFEGKKIVEPYSIRVTLDKKETKDSVIESDIKDLNKYVFYLDDTKTDDQYFFYVANIRYFFEDDWEERESYIYLVNKNADILFDKRYMSSMGATWAWVDSKDLVLDRKTFKNTDPEDEYYGKYALYLGDNEKEYNHQPMEFFKDHFYGFNYEDSDNYTHDYKYTVENGTLMKETLNKNDKGYTWTGAGES